MDKATSERFDAFESRIGKMFDTVFEKLDAAAEGKTQFQAHEKRTGPIEIHHLPPCGAMKEHISNHSARETESRRMFWTKVGILSGLIATGVGLAIKLIL